MVSTSADPSVCPSSSSRNQLSVLPAVVCSLPLKVLIASNNKLVSLPEELGQLRHLTELVSAVPDGLIRPVIDQNFCSVLISCCRVWQDVSCNEIRTLPSQVGQLEALRDLNIRRNHLVRLPSGKLTQTHPDQPGAKPEPDQNHVAAFRAG